MAAAAAADMEVVEDMAAATTTLLLQVLLQAREGMEGTSSSSQITVTSKAKAMADTAVAVDINNTINHHLNNNTTALHRPLTLLLLALTLMGILSQLPVTKTASSTTPSAI
uniref:Uncharacterized protein n=1 Tax=Bionectria ochroleuca TaxID=29856 RepID=A0A8H7NK68_BIOOC